MPSTSPEVTQEEGNRCAPNSAYAVLATKAQLNLLNPGSLHAAAVDTSPTCRLSNTPTVNSARQTLGKLKHEKQSITLLRRSPWACQSNLIMQVTNVKNYNPASLKNSLLEIWNLIFKRYFPAIRRDGGSHVPGSNKASPSPSPKRGHKGCPHPRFAQTGNWTFPPGQRTRDSRFGARGTQLKMLNKFQTKS